MLEIIEDDQIQSIRSDPERTHKTINLSRRTSTLVIFSSGHTILMRFGGSIALHQMKLRTRHLDKMKAYDHMQLLRARGLIPTDGSRAHRDQMNLENINDNHPSSPEMFRAEAALNTTAWVLLSE